MTHRLYTDALGHFVAEVVGAPRSSPYDDRRQALRDLEDRLRRLAELVHDDWSRCAITKHAPDGKIIARCASYDGHRGECYFGAR